MKKKTILAKQELESGVILYHLASKQPLVIARDETGQLALCRGAASCAILPGFRAPSDLEPMDVTPEEEAIIRDYLMEHYLDLVNELGIIV